MCISHILNPVVCWWALELLPFLAIVNSAVMNIATAAAKSLQSCPTLCDPIDGSPPGSRIPGILQARTLEWVAISFSNAWKWKGKVKSLSRVQLLATPRTAVYQAPVSMGFSRQNYLSGVPLWTLGFTYNCFKLVFLLFQYIYPGVELLDHMVVLFLVL